MIIKASTDDIVSGLTCLSEHFEGIKNTIPLVKECFKLDNGICITKSLPIISGIKLKIMVTAEDNSGNLDLNITQATIAGIGFFGVLRVQAAKLIIKAAAPYTMIKLWKNNKGNLTLSIPQIYFSQAGIVGDKLYLDFKVLT